ncbi:MAG: McrB family protein [Coriobacteriia bacterium]
MAILKREGADKIYAVARMFREQALERDGSLLTPGRAVWTIPALEDLEQRFVLSPDGSSRSFDEKLERQLDGASDAAKQLMAELLLMHLLVVHGMSADTKRLRISCVLGWMRDPVGIPPDIDAALHFGLASPGTHFYTRRDNHLRFFIEWMLAWKRMEPSARAQTLSEPWAFREQICSVDDRSAWLQRNALLHLVFPETFERAVARNDKKALITAFANRIGGPAAAAVMDEDKAILEIRKSLESTYGPGFDFYEIPELVVQWNSRFQGGVMEANVPLLDRVRVAYPGWQGFADERFVHDETTYKMDASAKARTLLAADELRQLIEDEQFDEVVQRVEKVAHITNMLWLQAPQAGDLAILYRQGFESASFSWAVFDLLYGQGTSPERLGRYAEYAVSHGLPARWTLPTYLLMLIDPESELFVKPEATKWFLKQMGVSLKLGSKASGEIYASIREAAEDLREQLAPFEPKTMLDIQSYIWVAYRAGEPAEASPPAAASGTDGEGNRVQTDAQAATVYEHIRSKSYQFPDWLVTDYVLSLATKPLVILSGISGTGKTKMAQLVSEFVAPEVMESVARYLPEPVEGSILHEAKRVLVEHFYVAIRTRQADLFPLPERGSGLDVELRVPGLAPMPGRLQSVGGARDDGLTLRLYLKGSARDWVRSQFKRGDYIRISPEGPDSTIIGVEHIPVDTVEAPTPSKRIAFLSVRPDWTDNRALLGYFNPLLQRYQGTELLSLLLRAEANPDEPHFVVLDEMNLAKVEYYFSDFLSAMESGTEMVLHDVEDEETDAEESLPSGRLKVPTNVFFTGTVNVDETTYMFSPKVLDRANTIEFNSVDLDEYGRDGGDLADAFRLRDGVTLEALLAASRRPGPEDWTAAATRSQERIRAIHSLMAEYNLHFGYRVANEIARYLALTKEFVGEDQLDFALDLQVLQKVLPKLSGSRAKLEKPLEALLEHLESEGLNMSAAKVSRMLATVRAVGFVSFVE